MNDLQRNPSLAACTDETAATAADLERQMAELGLSGDTCRFLRHLHAAEKQLNDAYDMAQRSTDREQCVSQVYRELYGSDDAAAVAAAGRGTVAPPA